MASDGRSRENLGLVLGFIGVAVFGGTSPFTRLAVQDLDPWFVTAGRAALSGLSAGATLPALRRPVPNAASVLRPTVVSSRVIVLLPER